MRSIVMPLVLAAALPVAAAAAKSAPKPPAPATVAVEGRQGDPELQSLRRQLAAAVLVSELKLDAEQKKALKSVVAEAKAIRDGVKSDPDLAKFRADRKLALKAAVDEVHTKGSLSEATKKSLKDGAKDAPVDREEMREKFQALRESVKGILTAQQMEKLQEMRAKRGEKMERKGFGRPGRKQDGRQLLHLMMSDELAAELDR